MGERNGGAIEFSFPSSSSSSRTRVSLVALRRDDFPEFCSQMDRHCFDPFFPPTVFVSSTKKTPSLHRNYLPIEIKAQIYFNRCAVEREAIDFSFPPFLDLHPLVLPWNIYSGNHEFLWFFVSSGAFNYYRENNVLRFLR